LTTRSFKLFDPSGASGRRSSRLHEASFIERPNRFIVRAELDGAVVDAHCPNPGRLLEILVPGTSLLLAEKRRGPERRGKRGPRLPYSLIAARHRGIIIPLASVRANDLAERVILPALFPQAKGLHREVTMGQSRLDFLLETKGCTLIAEKTAMFPDAPTLRGLKHLEELEALADQGLGAGILFVLMNPEAGRFVPNLHTDPAFTRKLISLKGKIWMRAVSIRTGEDGWATLAQPDVPIDLDAATCGDRGVYLLVAEVQRRRVIDVGALGDLPLEPGWHVYVGSGKRNLSARIARHHRKSKKMHWHIDYLLAHVDSGCVTSLPIRSRHELECRLARSVADLAVAFTPGFGCSDCRCTTHLFRFDSDPLQDRRFLDLLLHYRHTVALA
jgi:sugar fermentation stimulation protein A